MLPLISRFLYLFSYSQCSGDCYLEELVSERVVLEAGEHDLAHVRLVREELHDHHHELAQALPPRALLQLYEGVQKSSS